MRRNGGVSGQRISEPKEVGWWALMIQRELGTLNRTNIFERGEAMERMERLERRGAIEPFELLERSLGFGSLAVVVEPASLVKEIKDDLGKALRSYAKR